MSPLFILASLGSIIFTIIWLLLFFHMGYHFLTCAPNEKLKSDVIIISLHAFMGMVFFWVIVLLHLVA